MMRHLKSIHGKSPGPTRTPPFKSETRLTGRSKRSTGKSLTAKGKLKRVILAESFPEEEDEDGEQADISSSWLEPKTEISTSLGQI